MPGDLGGSTGLREVGAVLTYGEYEGLQGHPAGDSGPWGRGSVGWAKLETDEGTGAEEGREEQSAA